MDGRITNPPELDAAAAMSFIVRIGKLIIPIYLSKKLFLEIHKIHPLLRTGQSSVKPSQVFHLKRFFLVQRRIDEDTAPLPALGLVAGEGVGEFHLQGVEP